MPVVCLVNLVDKVYGVALKDADEPVRERIMNMLKNDAKEQCLCDECKKEREHDGQNTRQD